MVFAIIDFLVTICDDDGRLPWINCEGRDSVGREKGARIGQSGVAPAGRQGYDRSLYRNRRNVTRLIRRLQPPQELEKGVVLVILSTGCAIPNSWSA